jgi:hypothetical protein
MRTVLLLAGTLAAATALGAPPPAPGRIVILGFDGVDAAIVEQMLASGRLPNLAALKARGAYSPLVPTIPAQTPVSWATFSTGLDPGGHEIFDFLKRNPADRVPTFAVAEELEVPFLLGRANGPVFGAGALVLFSIVGAAVFLRTRKILWLIGLDLLGIAAGVGVFLAVRAWVPPA